MERLIFVHIPKTGGTTLQLILNRQYGRKVFNVKNEIMASKVAKVSTWRNKRIKCLKGHLPFGYHKLFPNDDVKYISMLRDPVKRVISFYHFVKSRPHHHNYPAIVGNNLSIKEFVESGVNRHMENCQLRFISNNIYTPFGECTERMLDQAKENIEKHIAVCGITEMFDESLIFMKKEFNWVRPFYYRENVTGHGVKPSDLDQDTLDVILKYNQLDIELYNWAKERLKYQIECEKDWFFESLDSYQKWNKKFQKMVELKRKVLPNSSSKKR